MPDQTPTLDSGEPAQNRSPRAQRTSVMLTAIILAGEGGEATRHRVRNLSSSGMRIDNAHGLQCGAAVLISLGALQAVRATVQWTRAGLGGLAFVEEIHPEDARKKAAGALNGLEIQDEAETLNMVLAPTAGWVGEMRSPYRT